MSISERQIFRTLIQNFVADGTPFVFVARGRSMTPFIKDGDSVLIKPCSSGVRIGDVVLLRSGDRNLLLHRVIKRKENGIITRGDACIADDGYCCREDIMGRVVKIVGKRTSLHLFFPLNYFLALVLRLRAYPWVFLPLRAILKRVFFVSSGAKGY